MGFLTADTAVVFQSSVCPEPEISNLIGFTFLSGLTILSHLVLSHAQKSTSNYPNPDGHLEKVIKSIVYLVTSLIMLVDACWLAHIYSWGITGFLAAPTRSIIEWGFIRLWVAAQIAFLLVLGVLWLWTLWKIASYFFELWAFRDHSSDVSTQVLKREAGL